MINLEITWEGEAHRFALEDGEHAVGRSSENPVQVAMARVSKRHALIRVDGDNLFVKDLGSRNGIFVNSVRVDRQELRHGDLITIGETQFRFVESMAH